MKKEYIFRDSDFKDESPSKTVENIKSILASVDIETEESWFETNVPYCYALRVTVKGTTFGVNGKGLTKAFALASGYGELMERLQLGYIGSRNVQKDGHYSVNDGQTVIVGSTALLQNTPDLYARLSAQLQNYTGISMSPNEILKQYCDEHGNVATTPFFSLCTDKQVLFPNNLRKAVYTTNGCAAGNTTEEALVQAISEIVERHHHMKIVEGEITLPDIPDNILQKYAVAYDIIMYLRSQGYRVLVKDASLGTKFPVVCVCYIEENSGKYHTHFGAYPIFEIALERALTETFQGRDINTFASFDNFFFRKDDKYNIASVTNELTKGTWERTTSFFVGNPKYPFNEYVGFSGKDNKEILSECIEMFTAAGYDILVRDGSCLGFPTYQVIIPGYSELFIYRLNKKLNDTIYSSYAVKSLRNPPSAKIEDMLGFAMHMNHMSQLPANIVNAHGFLANARLSAQMDSKEERCLMAASMAYIWYALNRNKDVLKCIENMFPTKDQASTEYLICLKRYLTLKSNQYTEEHIHEILKVFHKPETMEK